MDENNKRVEYTYKIEGANTVSSEVLGQPLFITFTEKKKLEEVVDELVETCKLKQYDHPFTFEITAILATFEEDEPQLAHYNPVEEKSDGPVLELHVLTIDDVYDVVSNVGGSAFWISPKGVHPLKEGIRLRVTSRDIEEKRKLNDNGKEMSRFELKLQLMNSMNFNRPDDAPFDFYLIEEGEEF